MLCCSAIVFLLGQCGAFGAAVKVRLFGGSGVALASIVGNWGTASWLALPGALAVELAIAATAMPALYALDIAARASALGNWPVCAAVLKALTR